jgi:hypothetical protein
MLEASETAVRGVEGDRTRAFTAKESAAERAARREDLLIREKGDTLRTGITAASAKRAGEETGLTPGQYMDAQKALNEAKTALNTARAKWVARGRPKTDNKSTSLAGVAQAFIDADNMYKEMKGLVSSMPVRGGFGSGGGQSDVVDVAWK